MRPEFTRVSEVVSKVAIVATGSSLKDVKLKFPDDIAVITVNSALHHVNRKRFWFTLDPSESNRRLMMSAYQDVTYYAAVPDEFQIVSPRIKHLRRITGNGHGRYRTKGSLSRDKGAIHTGNSAWGALQLAVHMEASQIALFGVDGYGEYYYGGNPRDLSMMNDLFSSAVSELNEMGIEVVNGSRHSHVTCFQRMEPEEALKWLVNWML